MFLYGTRLSLLIGLSATFVSLFFGVIYGAVSGMAGRRIDNLMMRFVDVLYGLPFMFVVIILLAVMGERSVLLLFMALGAVQWLTMARVVRSEVLSVREKEYVTAARSLGAGRVRILFRHILPNISDTILVYATFTVPMVIIEEAFLFLSGFGRFRHPWPGLGTLIPLRYPHDQRISVADPLSRSSTPRTGLHGQSGRAGFSSGVWVYESLLKHVVRSPVIKYHYCNYNQLTY